MVTKWGLSSLGPLTFGDNEQEVFLGHSVARHKEISESTSGGIDQEVCAIINRNYQRAEKLLKENLDKLHIMAQALVKYETINIDQINDIMSGIEVREPPGWNDPGGQTKEPPPPSGNEQTSAAITVAATATKTAGGYGSGPLQDDVK
jgi:cell division protease FtsH